MNSITIKKIDEWFIDLLSSDKHYIYGLYHEHEEEEDPLEAWNNRKERR